MTDLYCLFLSAWENGIALFKSVMLKFKMQYMFTFVKSYAGLTYRLNKLKLRASRLRGAPRPLQEKNLKDKKFDKEKNTITELSR